MRKNGAVRLPEDEVASQTGPFQYNTRLLKDSVTSPKRSVHGVKSLNKCIASRPSSLNPMFNVMLRYRYRPVAVQFDMAKAYITSHSEPLDRFTWISSPSEP